MALFSMKSMICDSINNANQHFNNKNIAIDPLFYCNCSLFEQIFSDFTLFRGLPYRDNPFDIVVL